MASDLTGNIYNTGALSYVIFYRVKGTSGPFLNGGTVTAVPSPAIVTPFTIQDVAPNEYEFYFVSNCANGEVSDPSDTFYSVPVCQPPLGFNVQISGNNFIINYSVPQSIGIINLQILYPNGGNLNQNYNVASPGSITVPVPPGQFGDYTFSLRSVCNEASGWFSNFTNPVLITTTNPSPCTPPIIGSYVLINTTSAALTYRFALTGYTPSVRVVITNNTTGGQQILTQAVINNYFDTDLIIGLVDYNYTVQVFNLCTVGTDSQGASANILVPAQSDPVNTAGWTISAGPDNQDLDGDGVIGTMVTVNTNGLTPSATRTCSVVVRFACSTSGYAYVNVNIAPGTTMGTTRDWNSGCTIDTASAYINSAILL